RSSSAIEEVYVRPKEQRREGDRPDPNGCCEKDMQEHEAPGEMRAPLQLSETHLGEQQDEDARAEREESGGALPPRGEVAEAEQEGQQEHTDDRAVHVDDRLEPAEPVDLVRGAATGVRPRGG